MEAGTFDPMLGKPIWICRGRLKEGRHRVMALILTGRPQILNLVQE